MCQNGPIIRRMGYASLAYPAHIILIIRRTIQIPESFQRQFSAPVFRHPESGAPTAAVLGIVSGSSFFRVLFLYG